MDDDTNRLRFKCLFFFTVSSSSNFVYCLQTLSLTRCLHSIGTSASNQLWGWKTRQRWPMQSPCRTDSKSDRCSKNICSFSCSRFRCTLSLYTYFEFARRPFEVATLLTRRAKARIERRTGRSGNKKEVQTTCPTRRKDYQAYWRVLHTYTHTHTTQKIFRRG